MMRNLTLICIMCAASIVAHAQGGKVITAFSSYTAYLSSDRTDKAALEEGYQVISEAAVHESTSNQPKTFYYKGYIEQLISEDEELSKKYPNTLVDAANSYMKSIELSEDPEARKFRMKDDVVKFLGIATGQLHNTGIVFYDAQEVANAYSAFTKALESAEFLKSRGEGEAVKLNTDNSMFLAAICANNLTKTEEAAGYFKKLIEANYENVYIYKGLSNILVEKGDNDAALAVLEKGSKAFPEDPSVTIDMINIYLQNGRETEAIDVMKKAIEQEPNNPQLYFVLANTYGKLGNEEKTIETYNKAIEIDPSYADAYNNLGALYLEKANAVVEKMNDPKISNSDYEKLDKERVAFLEQALPFLEKANELKPESLEIMDVLKTIYAKLGMYDKSKAIKEQILKIQGK